MRHALFFLALLIPTACDARKPHEARSASGPARLVGRVVDESNQPLEGVVVLAANQTTPDTWPLDAPYWADKERASLRAVTGIDGRFRFEALEAGTAQLSLRSPKLALLDLYGLELGGESQRNLGDVRLQPGIQLRGTVLSSNRKPTANAGVFYLRPESTTPHANPSTGVLLTHTDSRGKFEINQLEPGPFTLAIVAIDEAPSRIHGHTANELDLGEITLPPPSTISGIVKSFPLGELDDLNVVALPTKAVPFAQRPGSNRGQPAHLLEGYQTAIISDSGSFFFTNLIPDCDYSLRVLAPGDRLRVNDTWSPPKLVRSGTQDVVLTVHPSVRMEFRVVDADTGTLLTDYEHEWTGARNLPRDGADYLRATNSSRRVHLRVKAPGYASYQSPPLALVTGNSLAPFRAELTPGETPPITHATPEASVNWIASLPGFEPAAELESIPIKRGRNSLTGVLRVSGEPLAGAVLRLFPFREREAFFTERDNALELCRTDRAGRFQFHSVPLGEHILAIEHESRSQLTLHTVLASEVEIELEDHTLQGRVVSADGSPIANAAIHLPRHWKREARLAATAGDNDQNVIAWRDLRAPPLAATTDAEGRFTLTGLESGNALTLGARSAHFGTGSLRLANLDQEATLMLSSNSTLIVEGVDSRLPDRALGLAWRWGRNYGHEIRFSYSRPLNREFRGLSADEWTLFHADFDGWGELSSMRILAPVLLDPVGDSRVLVQH